MKRRFIRGWVVALSLVHPQAQAAPQDHAPWVWPSEPPAACPFPDSTEIVAIAFTGRHRRYLVGDTWYPSWATDDRLYSPFTDGKCPRLDGGFDLARSFRGKVATTGHAVLEGADPLNLKMYSLGLQEASAEPYAGRYPAGSLVHNGVWYYGTYCLSPSGDTRYGHGPTQWNWPWLGPFVGFRVSRDYGRTWSKAPHTPEKPLFGETGLWGYPVKIGVPHFVDFGRNMEFSPDGKAYLVAHGATETDPKPRFANLSWITGDQIYLLRVTPSIETINDPKQYEFFAGSDAGGRVQWTRDFDAMRPLVEWNNNCGSVTVTYNAPLKRYLMLVTDGWPTTGPMNTYMLESASITGPWALVTYLKGFGEQAYFVNIPSKFISPDGRTMWLAYSANFAVDRGRTPIYVDPPGSGYGLVLQEIHLLDREGLKRFRNNPRPARSPAPPHRGWED